MSEALETFTTIYKPIDEERTKKDRDDNNIELLFKEKSIFMGAFFNYDPNFCKEPDETHPYRIIKFCPESICNTYYDLVGNGTIDKDYMSFRQFFDKVMLHEFGHCAFSNDKLDKLNLKQSEQQANYFASLMFNGHFDKEIYNLTVKQPSIYKDPILISQRLLDSTYDDKVKKLFKFKR